MPRNLTVWNQSRIHRHIVYRRHLLAIHFQRETVYLCSGDSLQYMGQTWHSIGMRFQTDLYSYVTATLTDRDNYVSDQIVTSDDETLVPTDLYLLMGNELDVPDGSHDELFTGELSDLHAVNENIRLRAEVDVSKVFPSLIASKVAGLRHLPASPLTVEYGDNTYQVTT